MALSHLGLAFVLMLRPFSHKLVMFSDFEFRTFLGTILLDVSNNALQCFAMCHGFYSDMSILRLLQLIRMFGFLEPVNHKMCITGVTSAENVRSLHISFNYFKQIVTLCLYSDRSSNEFFQSWFQINSNGNVHWILHWTT